MYIRTVIEHSSCGVHSKSLALWESGTASATGIGTLPAPARHAIADIFHLVYRMAKRGRSPANMPRDAEALQRAGAYHPKGWVVTVTHGISRSDLIRRN